MVVVGGYGHVGRRLIDALDARVEVVVAGRRPDAAARAAEESGRRACTTPVDVSTGAGLGAAVRPGDLVVNVAGDDPRATLLRTAIELGCDYADLTADPATIAAMVDLDRATRDAGVSALAGIGLAPGATNVLARAAVDRLPGAEHVDIGLLLSATDDFGPAALEWTFATAAEGLRIQRQGRVVAVEPFRASTRMHLGGRVRTTYAFGFPEQVFLPETLGLTSAAGWFALDPALMGRGLAAVAGRRTVRRWLSRPGVRRRLVRLAVALPSPARGRHTVAAAAVARRGSTSVSACLTSEGEDATTAACAAALLETAPWSAGVHLPEQTVDPEAFRLALEARGITMEVLAPATGDAVVR
jgi:hypothetical protein